MEQKEIVIGRRLEIPTGYKYHGDEPFQLDVLLDHLNDCKKNGFTHIKIYGYCDGENDVFQIDITALKCKNKIR